MKQFIRYGALAVTLLFVAVSAYLASCSKKSAGNDLAESGLTGGFVSSCGDPLNGSTVLEVIRNDHDPVDDKITLIQYHYARAIRQVIKNQTHRCLLISAINNEAGGKGASIFELALNNSAFAASINSELRASINSAETANIYPRGSSGESGIDALRTDPTWDVNTFLRNKMIYTSFSYDPVVYFGKQTTTCEGLGTITVLIAQDVDDCDDVAGWHGDDEVVFGERDVATAPGPVIFVGPGKAIYMVNPFVSNEGEPTKIISTKMDASEITERAPLLDNNVDSHGVNAGFRFEANGKSELKGWVVRFSPAGTPFSINVWNGDFNPRKITKSQIAASTIFQAGFDGFSTPSSPATGANTLFYGTYEWDWWVFGNTQNVLNTCSSIITHSVSVQMKFATEFYFSRCGALGTIFPSVGSTDVITNPACTFTIRREI